MLVLVTKNLFQKNLDLNVCHEEIKHVLLELSYLDYSSDKRLSLNFSEIDFSSLKLTFEDIPEDRSELVNIARDICNLGGSSGTVFNAANEIAVQSFLEEQITFDKIYEVIYRTFDAMPMSKNIDINTIYETDNQTRMEAKKVVKSIS